MPRTKEKIVIIGISGHAGQILDIIEALQNEGKPIECVGYAVDKQYGKVGDLINGLTILGDIEWLSEVVNHFSVICGIGEPSLRYKMIRRLSEFKVKYSSVIHPSVIRSKRISIGEGSIIQAGTILTNNITN